ncbi:conserved hypothetical protein [Microcystis aeruginosa PCC 9443]|uniref:Uncharacterized protein n=1 Tax=Microcystis aeruginosa PCC 9443 TaxID=1160281 RepID=I4G4P2_MICAE|nr:conserved hypothetical protein [Microcystis aeruginosa PCC 9443]
MLCNRRGLYGMKTFVVDLEPTNQLSLLSDQDLVDLCPPIKPDLVTKNRNSHPFIRRN